MDTDKDGTVSKKELQYFIKNLDGPAITPASVTTIIRKVDSNGDGIISFQEFEDALQGILKRFNFENGGPKAGKKSKSKKKPDLKKNYLTTGQDTFNKIAAQAKTKPKKSKRVSKDNSMVSKVSLDGTANHSAVANSKIEKEILNEEDLLCMMEIELDGAKTEVIKIYAGQDPREIAN